METEKNTVFLSQIYEKYTYVITLYYTLCIMNGIPVRRPKRVLKEFTYIKRGYEQTGVQIMKSKRCQSAELWATILLQWEVGQNELTKQQCLSKWQRQDWLKARYLEGNYVGTRRK